MPLMFSNIMIWCAPQTFGIICGFGCPRSKKKNEFIRTTSIVVNLEFSGVLKVPGVGMFEVS